MKKSLIRPRRIPVRPLYKPAVRQNQKTSLDSDKSLNIRTTIALHSSPEEEVQSAPVYEDVIVDVRRQTRVEFQFVVNDWVQEVFPNILAEKIEELEYVRRPAVEP